MSSRVITGSLFLLLSVRHSPDGAPPPALVAIVNVYVLVTSVKPLTSFLHDISVVTTNQEQRGRPTKVKHLFHLISFHLQVLTRGRVTALAGDLKLPFPGHLYQL